MAKKRGGSRGISRSSSSSRGRISSSIRKAITRSKGAKGQKVLRTLFGGKKGKLGNVGKVANKGVKRKGGFLRKAGKYAVVGLAGKKNIDAIGVNILTYICPFFHEIHLKFFYHF